MKTFLKFFSIFVIFIASTSISLGQDNLEECDSRFYDFNGLSLKDQKIKLLIDTPPTCQEIVEIYKIKLPCKIPEAGVVIVDKLGRGIIRSTESFFSIESITIEEKDSVFYYSILYPYDGCPEYGGCDGCD